jgi:PAS domain S-box-containing protein
MTWNWKTPSLGQRLLAGLLIVAAASAFRMLFFSGLGRGIPYLVYYPATMLAALYGGLATGFLATVLSSILVFFWVQQGNLSPPEWLGLLVFVISCLAISIVCEKLRSEIIEHKHMAEVSADSEIRYRRLFEAAKDGILILDAETGMVVDVNPFMVDLLGVTREVFLNKKVWELGFFKDLVANEANFIELQQKEYIRYEDMALEGFDGKRHEVEFVSNVYLVNHHKVIQCNIRDISERKREESEAARMVTVVRDSNDAITIQDFEGRITAWNHGAELMYGYSEAEALEMNIEHLTAPGKVSEQKDFVRRLLAGEAVTSLETQRVTKDGRILDVWMTVTKLVDKAGKPIGIASTERDTTERKREADALRQSEERYRTLFSTLNEGVCIIEVLFDAHDRPVDYRFLEINPAFEAQTGLRNALGKRMRELAPKHEAYWFEIYGKVAVTGEPARFTNEARALHRWYDVSAYRVGGRDSHRVAILFSDITARKREAEEAARMVTVVRDSNDAITIQDFEGRITAWNHSAELMYGYSEAEALEMNIERLTAPGKVAEQKDFVRRLVAGEAVTSLETQRVTKDGRILDVWMTVTKLVDKAGKPIGIASTERDITARKREEKNLRRFATVVKDSNDAITIQDFDGRITAWNRGAELMYGYSEAEALTENIERLTVPDKVGEQKDFIRRMVAGEAITSFETQRVTKDGRVLAVWMTVTKLMDEAGNPIGLASTERDITARKQSEEALRESEGRYRMLFENAQDGIALADVESGILVDCNPALCRIAEREKAELVGQPQAILHSPRDVTDGQSSTFRQHRTMEAGRTLESQILSKSGTLTPVDIRASRIRMGGRAFLLGIFRDIIERKQAAAEKEKLQGQLIQAQKMESIGRLAGGVAHDFNNMLMVIMGNAELCKMKLDAGNPLHKWLGEISKGAVHARTLTRQLLTFARKQIIAPEILNINAIVSDMLKILSRLIGEDIRVVWRPSAVLGLVNMDPSQIDQILTNLAVNARDAIKGTGTITIETANATFDPSYCDQYPGVTPGNYVLLAFSDTGCGMDQETQTHIFEPFFTTKEVDKGTGLGLATVYGIVKQNNGYIDVYSEPGHGTQFKIYLPYALDQSVQPVTEETPEEAVGGRETVLLVEDGEPVRAITHEFLASLGYTVLVADRPEKALRLAEQHPGKIHLLLTDVIMPGMNGRDLSLRLAEIRPSIKSLFISGFTADVLTQRGILASGLNFLPKPFSRDKLARKVREVLTQISRGQNRKT